MRVDGEWFKWISDNVLFHKKERNGMSVLSNMYNNKFDVNAINYNYLLNLRKTKMQQ